MTVRRMLQRTRKPLDGERVWNLWAELGSMEKVRQVLGSEEDGDEFVQYTAPGLYLAAKRYLLVEALKDRAKAKKMLEYSMCDDKTLPVIPVISDDEFDRALVRIALTALRQHPATFDEFISAMNLGQWSFMWQKTRKDDTMARPLSQTGLNKIRELAVELREKSKLG